MDLNDAVARWRAGGENRDAAQAVTALAPEVRLISPITDQFEFAGREQVRVLLEVALPAIDAIRYTDEIRQGPDVALFYEGSIDGLRLHEAQRLRLADDGLIAEITLFIRPLPALTKLMSRLGPELARRYGRPALARLLPLASGMLHGMAATGETRIMPKAAPR
ncbi:hypothetical protein [Actinoplanes sp. NPDC026619]|uniref:hypothetical protein n=1 Tax=Actinoplanes sp. NPDC026619 TaxID=3155798 RepID=UPI0033DFCA08